MKAMKFYIRDDPELCEKVQKLLFDLGYGWYVGYTAVKYLEAHYLYTFPSGYMGVGGVGTGSCFDQQDAEEINIDWLRSRPKETVELNGETYLKKDLEAALAKLEPVE